MSNAIAPGFHDYYDARIVPYQPSANLEGWTLEQRKLSYRFYSHFHPYVADLVRRLIEKSVSGLQAADTEYVKDSQSSEIIPAGPIKPEDYELFQSFFQATYHPNPELVPDTKESPYPVKDLDFTSGGAYSIYNWELFFHAPLSIAIQLSKNQRFEEAQQWFHYIFDPTDDSGGPTPARFWKVKPFQTTDVERIEDILVNLATGDNPTLQQDTINSINAWKDAPFSPHAVARYRQSAYMFKTVTAYLDNLIAWGDSLFREDTGETINEAMQLYVLAANILGPRPQAVPKKGSVRPQTYASLKKDLKAFGVALVAFETNIPFVSLPHPEDATESGRSDTLRSIGHALYFCIPRSDNLLSYWDTVADRLFKIRNSLNIQGIFRQLPLFEPPIDPALLAKATAAGLDVGAIVNGANQPLSLVRFQILVQKAAEICQEVKSLGNNLLSAIEKEDNEAMAVLRARHEGIILELAEMVKYAQLQEAIKSREGLLKSLANAAVRYSYYERLLGKLENDIKIPDIDALDKDNLEHLTFRADEPEMRLRATKLATAVLGGQLPLVPMNLYELGEIGLLINAQIAEGTAVGFDALATVLGIIPDAQARITPWGVGAGATTGGITLSRVASSAASATRTLAGGLNFMASMTSKIGSYVRRAQEWEFQSNLAAGEITQIFKQLRAAQIREAIAEREWKNHQKQIGNAEEIEQFLKGEEISVGNGKHRKISTQALYTWMKREVRGLYAQTFQFAFDVARKAERALQHELGDPQLSFLQFGYLAGKEGLLAGEKLYMDIKRMEMAYHDLNQREYELTKHVSLLQVNPLALLQLRTTGRCIVSLPETLFDVDGPGHYFRRIKTVALSIPCVTGPYASVNCTLTMLKSSIRKTQVLHGDIYARGDAEDDRFSDYFGSLQSIVTSSAQNDSGLFETNLRDERYLPFEGSGAISEWQLELPANPSKGDPLQFDYDTISDVILHLRYTAREGGGLLRKEAVRNVTTTIAAAQAAGSVRLFPVRHEFPTEWANFQGSTPGVNQRFALALTLGEEHYPFWSQGRLKSVRGVDIFARSTQDPIHVYDKVNDQPTAAVPDDLTGDQGLGDLLVGKFTNIALPTNPKFELKLFFDDRTMEDLWIAITWSSE